MQSDAMMSGLGIECSRQGEDYKVTIIRQAIPKFLQNIEHQHSSILLQSWIEIWRGTVISYRTFMETDCEILSDTNELQWTIELK